jgi:F-type H+-transporting ATPase subunit delta
MSRHEIASRRYGSALFEVAKASDKVDLFLEELGEVSTKIINNDDLNVFLNHPNITGEEKKKVIVNVFKNKVEDQIIQLIFLLIDHSRISEIRIVYYDYKYLVYKERGIRIAYVTTAVEMTKEEIELLRNKLHAKYESDIEVQNIVNKHIIGGVYLKIGDKVIDGTVRGSLDGMKRLLMNNYSEVKI